jgi:hypothetical protein
VYSLSLQITNQQTDLNIIIDYVMERLNRRDFIRNSVWGMGSLGTLLVLGSTYDIRVVKPKQQDDLDQRLAVLTASLNKDFSGGPIDKLNSRFEELSTMKAGLVKIQEDTSRVRWEIGRNQIALSSGFVLTIPATIELVRELRKSLASPNP